jgi:hypothetical protein
MAVALLAVIMGSFGLSVSLVTWFHVAGMAQGLASTDFALFDRFRADCPADTSCVASFDPSLLTPNEPDDQHVWCAVYRSCNNAPSVMVRDEFLHAMRSATNAVNPTALTVESTSSLSNSQQSPNAGLVPMQSQQAPVAIARMRPSEDFPGSWVLDTMRCVLKKETQDASCDGGSEHLEAISTAIDALLEYHLSIQSSSVDATSSYQFSIRTKATLVSSKVLEDRGFVEVTRLEKDMATHVSDVDACLERYAERSVTTNAKSMGARQRALKIVSLLGRIERSLGAKDDDNGGDDQSDDYDPWASFKLLNS